MRTRIVVFFLAFYSYISYSQNTTEFFQAADAFFKMYVSSGKVAYTKINEQPEVLNQLLKMAEGIEVEKTEAATYQAFWINAYNLAVIKGIINNYPIDSPLDKSGFFDRTTYNLGGQKITLNDIENKNLRVKFDDARVHFVLVCGAIGCPPLISEAYMPNTLEAQLDRQTRKALNNPEFIQIKKNIVALSEIFKWYKEDFIKKGSEIDFINQFRAQPINTNYKVSYYPYNWILNKQ